MSIESSSVAIPPSFVCPITCCVMTDPYIDRDGNSYEKSAIQQWLSKNSVSPLTRHPLTFSQLIPNRALRDSINDWKIQFPNWELAAPPATSSSSSSSSPRSSSSSSSASMKADSTVDTHAVEVSASLNDSGLHVTLRPPVRQSRTPSDICCVIDVSGSMGSEVSSSSSSSAETSGFSQLDLVKHAMNTIIAALTPNDRLAIVSFHSSSTVELMLTGMNEDGRKRAKACVGALQADGGTNVWEGLRAGLETLCSSPCLRNQSIFLLTDGQSSEPPRGHIPTLQRYLQQHPFTGTIHGFGFGYDVDSKLLMDLSRVGQGSYAFIPDAGMVGTVFISALANMLTTVAQHTTLSYTQLLTQLLPQDDDLLYTPLTVTPITSTSTLSTTATTTTTTTSTSQQRSYKVSMPISVLLGDINRHIIIPLSSEARAAFLAQHNTTCQTTAPITTVTLDYVNVFENRHTSVSAPVFLSSSSSSSSDAVDNEVALVQRNAVLTLRRAVAVALRDKQLAKAESLVAAFIQTVKDHPLFKQASNSDSTSSSSSSSSFNASRFFADMVSDFESQVISALRRHDYFSRWGRHYLPSLACAHQFNVCMSFKDASIQQYSSVLFEKLRDELDDLFCKLPPPTPTAPRFTASSSASHPSPSSSSTTSSRSVSSISMAAFHNAAGPCVSGDSRVRLLSGHTLAASQLRAGMHLANGAIVTYVLRTTCYVEPGMNNKKCDGAKQEGNDRVDLCTLSSEPDTLLRITPYHPVCVTNVDNKSTRSKHWHFPVSLAPVQSVPSSSCRHLYSFVLSHTMTHELPMALNNVSMITLGHNRQDVDLLQHDYLGTQRVVDDLRALIQHKRQKRLLCGDEEAGMESEEERLVCISPCQIVRDPTTRRICGILPNAV